MSQGNLGWVSVPAQGLQREADTASGFPEASP